MIRAFACPGRNWPVRLLALERGFIFTKSPVLLLPLEKSGLCAWLPSRRVASMFVYPGEVGLGRLEFDILILYLCFVGVL